MTPQTKNVLKFFTSFAATAGVLGVLGFFVVLPYMQKDIGPDPMAEAHLFQIAKAYLINSRASTPPRPLAAQPGDTAHAAALLFAKNLRFVESRPWVVDNDALTAGLKRPVFVAMDNLGDLIMDPHFARLTLGVELAANVSLSSPASTPIAWTRGLQPDGTWSPDSPFNGLGGYMAFLDGHVAWFTQLGGRDGSPIFKFGTSEQTSDVREALPSGAVILSAFPKRLAEEVPPTPAPAP